MNRQSSPLFTLTVLLAIIIGVVFLVISYSGCCPQVVQTQGTVYVASIDTIFITDSHIGYESNQVIHDTIIQRDTLTIFKKGTIRQYYYAQIDNKDLKAECKIYPNDNQAEWSYYIPSLLKKDTSKTVTVTNTVTESYPLGYKLAWMFVGLMLGVIIFGILKYKGIF